MEGLAHVQGLPRRDWTTDAQDLADYFTDLCRAPGGTMRLHDYQGAALADLVDYGGLVLPWPVGVGKSITCYLAPAVVDAKRPLLIVPASLRGPKGREEEGKTMREIRQVYSKHFKIPPFHLQSYQTISRDWGDKYLRELKPDLIVMDECHALANTQSAAWRRVRDYIVSHRKKGMAIKLVFCSGTIMNRNLLEYAHLLRAALGPYAPIPRAWPALKMWSDATGANLRPGIERPDPSPLKALGEYDPHADTLTQARQAFGDRLRTTPGVVFVASSALPNALEIYAKFVDLPDTLAENFRGLREDWVTPDGHPFDWPMQLWAHARQLACGFFYRYNPRPSEEWFDARRCWQAMAGNILAHSRTYYSPGQVAEAIRAGDIPDPTGVLARWEHHRESFRPQTETVWVDDTVLIEAEAWLKKHQGICWAEHREFAFELGRRTGLPVFADKAVTEDGTPIEGYRGAAIATMACATGQNLQHDHHKNLIVSCVPTGKMHEQLIGRTHRQGQPQDTVTVDYIFACKEQLSSFWRAYEDALSTAESRLTCDAKLVCATIDVPRDSPMSGYAWT